MWRKNNAHASTWRNVVAFRSVETISMHDRAWITRRKINIASRYRVIPALMQRAFPPHHETFASLCRTTDVRASWDKTSRASRRNNVRVPMIRQISRQKFHVRPNGLLRSTGKYYDVDPEGAVGRRVISPRKCARAGIWSFDLSFRATRGPFVSRRTDEERRRE